MKQPDNNTQVLHFDLYGRREDKYDFLHNNSISTIDWNELSPVEPYNFFVPKDFDNANEYENGFKVDEMFTKYSSGIESQKDNIAVQISKKEINQIIEDFTNLSEMDLANKYKLKDARDWKISTSKIDVIKNGKEKISRILYRPFDIRFSYLSGTSKGLVAYPRYEISKNLLKQNIALLTCSRQTSFDFQHCFISKYPTERCTVSLQTGEVGYVFPLYLYSESSGQQSNEQTAVRTPNLNMEIVNKISEGLGLAFTSEIVGTGLDLSKNTFAPIDILDYIYAVLHSPTYREKYKEFLKIDFPRVPYPKDKETFWKLVKLGGELRQIHLLESPFTENYITQYPVDGNNEVTKPVFKEGAVFINDSQYFANVPEVAWNFYIGGYQPAQKWLKDRKGRKLEFDDILHYQKIIVALTETNRIMKEIDEIEIELKTFSIL